MVALLLLKQRADAANGGTLLTAVESADQYRQRKAGV